MLSGRENICPTTWLASSHPSAKIPKLASCVWNHLRPEQLTREQISCRLVAMALAGVSQRNTWHFRILVFLSLATYAKSLRRGKHRVALQKKQTHSHKWRWGLLDEFGATWRNFKTKMCVSTFETDRSLRQMRDEVTFCSGMNIGRTHAHTRRDDNGPQRSIEQRDARGSWIE